VALQELKILSAHIFQKFKVEVPNLNEVWTGREGSITPFEMKVIFKERN